VLAHPLVVILPIFGNPFASSYLSMELPTKAQYKIKTKKLSYKLCNRFHEKKNGIYWGKAPKSSYILKNVNCKAKPREIMAIAGPSGAGKTTLLEIFAGMIPPSRVSEHVSVNEQKMEAR
jgi:ABC-type multidrug transport system ATPase subunit